MPIIVDGAAMVDPADLPEELKGLAARHAVPLDHASAYSAASIVRFPIGNVGASI